MFVRFLRSKLFISVILLCLAAVIAFWALPKVTGAKSETTQVVQFVEDVKSGAVISDAMLVTKEIGKFGVDPTAITKKTDIVGKYAATDIRRGTNVFKDQFTEELYDVSGALDMLLKPEDRLVVLTLDNGASSVGGQLRPGSVVDVFTRILKAEEPDEEDEGTDDIYGYNTGYGTDEIEEMELSLLLERVVVYKIQNSALEDITELQRRYKAALEANDGSEEDIDSSMIPAFVTLIVSDDQAYDLVQQEKYSNGTVHLVLHPTETYTSDGVVGSDGKVIERIVNRADLPEENPEEENPEENPEGQPEETPENAGGEQGNIPAGGGGLLPTGGFIE